MYCQWPLSIPAAAQLDDAVKLAGNVSLCVSAEYVAASSSQRSLMRGMTVTGCHSVGAGADSTCCIVLDQSRCITVASCLETGCQAYCEQPV